MTEAALLIALAATAYLGFALLALSQNRHWRSVTGTATPTALVAFVLRALAGLALATSLTVALLRDGPSFGALLWATVLSTAAIAVAFTLSWRPHWLWPLAACFPGKRLGRTSSDNGS